MTVTQVAHAVGYEFANNFSTAFKRYYGILPKTYQTKFHANVNLASLVKKTGSSVEFAGAEKNVFSPRR
jgi:AraC-like DNA-binding protein